MGKSDGSIIIAHLARGISILAGEGNAVINIEDAVCAAGAPNGSRGFDRVLLGVDEPVGQGAAASHRHARRLRLARVLAEVVRRDEGPVHPVVQPRPPVVRRVDNRVLEATGVPQV